MLRSKTVAHNEIVTRTVTPDPAVQAIVDEAKVKSAPLANRQIGTITADLVRIGGASGETPLGDVIADAQLAATQANGAQIAITNPGGIRADFTYASSPAGEGDGVVTYGEAFTVQPFGNMMQTVTLTGAQLDAVLEQQWQASGNKFLQISNGFTYTMRPTNALGDRVSNLALNGTPIDPAGTYRVSINNFLAGGGDGFTVFTQGTDLQGGPIDLDALVTYFANQLTHRATGPEPDHPGLIGLGRTDHVDLRNDATQGRTDTLRPARPALFRQSTASDRGACGCLSFRQSTEWRPRTAQRGAHVRHLTESSSKPSGPGSARCGPRPARSALVATAPRRVYQQPTGNAPDLVREESPWLVPPRSARRGLTSARPARPTSPPPTSPATPSCSATS